MISNKTLLFWIVVCNIIMVFLLVDKQNKIVKAQYEWQKEQEIKELLLQQQKELMLACQKQQQLQDIQEFAKNDLGMSAIKLKDIREISDR